MRSTQILLSFVLLTLSSTATFAQQPIAVNTSETRARNLTEALLRDALSLNRHDKAMLYARLAEVWSEHDPQRVRKWFVRAVEIVEAPPLSKTEEVCQRTSARTLMSFVADGDKALTARLVAVMETSKQEQDQADRFENAHALATAGLTIANRDPKAARLLAEKSLMLGVSHRVALLLWAIKKNDANEGDKLFQHILGLANTRADYFLFSMLSIAVLNGPFSADKHRNLLVRSLADVIAQKEQGGSNEAVFCGPQPLLPPLLADVDRLLPEFSQRARMSISRCERTRNKAANLDQDQRDVAVPRTIDEFLRAARDTKDPVQRTRHLAQAVQLAAAEKDFDRALNILDSMDDADKNLFSDSWESWRWDYAASAACKYRTNDDFAGMNKIIDSTPINLRALARMALASCEAVNNEEELTNLLESARKDLERADPSNQPMWYMNLVKIHTKRSLATAPEIFFQAVTAINRAAKERKDECPTSTTDPTVLSNQILLDQYKLPVSVMEEDEAGVLDAISSIQPGDIRAALRLNLLKAVLEQQPIEKRGKSPSAGNTP
ncbi:MAG TPA: hypothetical protein VFY60_13900 [Pyrinomonadaceae bacterium]|nr:hypothetical protein [Pyrinomonadaceae bacterium]